MSEHGLYSRSATAAKVEHTRSSEIGGTITQKTAAVAPNIPHVIENMAATVEALLSVLTPEQKAKIRQSQQRELIADNAFEDMFSTKKRIAKVAKWAVGVCFGGATAVFGLGAGYQQAIGNNATQADLSLHVKTDLDPLKADVQTLKLDMLPIKVGITKLVAAHTEEEARAGATRRVQRLLNKHEQGHTDRKQAWAADRAAGRYRKQPTKSDTHLALEAELEALEDNSP